MLNRIWHAKSGSIDTLVLILVHATTQSPITAKALPLQGLLGVLQHLDLVCKNPEYNVARGPFLVTFLLKVKGSCPYLLFTVFVRCKICT